MTKPSPVRCYFCGRFTKLSDARWRQTLSYLPDGEPVLKDMGWVCIKCDTIPDWIADAIERHF